MKLQTPSNVFDMTKCLMKLQEKYLESVRYEFNLSRIEIIILTFLHNNPSYDSARDIVEFRMLQPLIIRCKILLFILRKSRKDT